MKIQLLAFASARDAVGADRLDLDLPEGLDLAGLRAKLEERRDADDVGMLGLLLEEVLDFDGALGRFRGGLVIHLEPEDHDKVAELGSLVGRHRGENRLFLEVTGTDGRRRRVRADERHGVRITSELAGEIDGLLGKGRAKLARV